MGVRFIKPTANYCQHHKTLYQQIFWDLQNILYPDTKWVQPWLNEFKCTPVLGIRVRPAARLFKMHVVYVWKATEYKRKRIMDSSWKNE